MAGVVGDLVLTVGAVLGCVVAVGGGGVIVFCIGDIVCGAICSLFCCAIDGVAMAHNKHTDTRKI